MATEKAARGKTLSWINGSREHGGSVLSSECAGDRENQWTKIITPERAWFDIDLGALWRYRYLVRLFVLRDLVATYKQTILGPAWFFISPLITAVVFTFVFGTIAAIPTDGMPPFLFYLCGTVCWGQFSRCLVTTSSVFVDNSHIFGKVSFPRLAIPVATVISSGAKFLVQLVILLGFMIYFRSKGSPVAPNWWAPAVLFLGLQAGIIGMAAGILIASVTTKYRDLMFFVQFGVQLWMYATPVVYPLSQVPERYGWFFLLNPMVAVVESFRLALLGTGGVGPLQMGMSVAFTILLLLAGLGSFNKTENTFMDRI
ncbi:MAG: ABC transporter permease [Desulfomonilaceae bacterium]|nr:ABC transporter permease [Desulfomonilaceae bacterium]